MTDNVEESLKSCIERYLELAAEITGTRPTSRHVTTSFLSEDQSLSKAGKPCEDGPCFNCPCCKTSLPTRLVHEQSAANSVCASATIANDVNTSSPSRTPSSSKKTHRSKTPVVLEDKGELQTAAASTLMNILYAARVARFDLLRPTCRLACFITKWTTLCDKQLHRLVCDI